MSSVAPLTAVFVIRSTARAATSSGSTTRRIGKDVPRDWLADLEAVTSV
jgi:hypothetical protein